MTCQETLQTISETVARELEKIHLLKEELDEKIEELTAYLLSIQDRLP